MQLGSQVSLKDDTCERQPGRTVKVCPITCWA